MQEKKKINLWQTILFSICGILVLDSIASPAMIGVSAITMWIITAIVFFIPYGLVNAELGSTYPDDGGIASWVQRSFAEKPAVLVGWYYWVNVAFWMPAVFVAFSSWFSMAFAPSASPWLLAAIAIVMCWLVVAIGIRGVDLSVAVSNIAAFCKVAIVVIMGILGVAYGVTRGFANDFSLSSFVPDMSHATEYIAIIVYNLLGFELISSVGGDIENPKKNIPKMTVFAGLIVTVLYIMGTFGILAAIPVDNISEADGFFYAIQELCSVFGPAQNADGLDLLGAGIVGDLQIAFFLNHAGTSLFRLLDDLNHAPALILGQGAGLHDLHTVASAALVVFVVGLELHSALQDFLVEGVLHAVLHGNDDGLIHLVGHNGAHTGLSQIAFHRLPSLTLSRSRPGQSSHGRCPFSPLRCGRGCPVG